MAKGKDNIYDPWKNKGIAYSNVERTKLGLSGLFPTKVLTLKEQVEAKFQRVLSIQEDYDKHLFLMNLFENNRILFYKLIQDHLKELLPIIYTPTIAKGVTNFSIDFSYPHDAIYIDAFNKKSIKTALKNGTKDREDVDLAVITDGEGVLGIGDWGMNGVMIAVGKTSVYTVAAGIHPKRMLAIVVDNGTNRKELLESKLYLGTKKQRQTGEKYYEAIDILVEELNKMYPNIMIHFEDFGRSNASILLKRYRNDYCTFNDDIQGTGIMMNAAMSTVSKITKKDITNHKFIIYGAGTAGIGISDQLAEEMKLHGLGEEDIKNNFFLVDRNGLILDDMDDLTDGQKYYAKNANDYPHLENLEEIIDLVQPTAIIGCSGQFGHFTKEVIQAMKKYNDRPAIMPISNPTSHCEATAEDIINYSEGNALVVTGSPSAPVVFDNEEFEIGQANNALLYPGFGLGIVTSKAKKINQEMLSAAAHAIVSDINLDKKNTPLLPSISMLIENSKKVAVAVAKAAIETGVSEKNITNFESEVNNNIWSINYT